MASSSRIATLLVAIILLSACAGPTGTATTQANTPPTATAAPTAVPTATPLPILAAGVRVAGVDVGGLALDDAAKKIEQQLKPALRSLELTLGSASTTLRPEQIELRLPVDRMLDEAMQAGAKARVDLQVDYDTDKLRGALERLAERTSRVTEIRVLTDTEEISRSFVLAGGAVLDIDAAMEQIDRRLRAPGSPRRITLPVEPAAARLRPTPEQLQEQIEALASEWSGVVGIMVYDLKSGEEVASLNKGTVFSAASTIKTAILLNSYINLDTFDELELEWLDRMVVESDNLAANGLLASAVGGGGTEEALAGALDMTATLRSMGLKYTYQYTPFEAGDYLRLRNIQTQVGPAFEGPEPQTEADPRLRTTPEEIAKLYLWIDQCANGQGPLLDEFDKLTPRRCEEMLNRLEGNGDRSRMVAGLPEGITVSHKSGWITDMQADAGIVRSPGGDFVVSIYIYRQLAPNQYFIPDQVIAPVIADFARLVYTYYNPVLAN